MASDVEETKGLKLEQLATHLPDLVIHRSPSAPIPHTVTTYGVVFFGDISGFTALCEKYCSTSVSKKRGTDQLTSTLNSYLSEIVQAILENGGDILKFAGDALLAYWPCHRFDANKVVHYLIKEMLSIQTNYDNYQTSDGVLLRMKIALSVGKSFIHYIGNENNRTFDFTGPAVDEVNVAQSFTKPGAVVITKTAWEMCHQDKCVKQVIEGTNDFIQVIEAQCDPDIISHSMLLQLLSHNTHQIQHVTSSRNNQLAPNGSGTHDSSITNEEGEISINVPSPPPPSPPLGGGFMMARNQMTVKENGLQLRKRVKRLLYKLTEEEQSGLKTYILRTVVQKIDHGYDVTWLSELRQVSVLFINFDPDFSLSTDITARGPKELLLLQTAFECVYPPLVKYDGTLNKVFMFDKGCTFLCIFGLPHASHENDPHRALEAAKEIFNALDNLRLSHYSIGVTTGIAFCGVVGHHERHEYTVIGEKVNMAARLMAKFPDALTCDETTRIKSSLPSDHFVQTLPIKLKGISNLEDIYFVSTENKEELTPGYLEAHSEQRSLIGRTEEMERFITKLQQVTGHTHKDPGVIIISGPGGIGKTKLLQAMKIKAGDMGFRVVSGMGGIIEQNTPFFTVKTLLTRLFELETCGNIHDKEQLILNHITDDEMRKYLPLLNDLLVLKFPQTSLTVHMDHKERRRNLHKLLFSIVHQEALAKPCVFGVDDAQWMDHDSWGFILDLALDPNAVLILSTRPIKDTDRTPIMNKIWNHPNTVVLNIAGLSYQETIAFLCQLLNVHEIDDEVIEVVCTRSHGIPLWCQELVETMLETNVLKFIDIIEEGQSLNLNKSSLRFASSHHLEDESGEEGVLKVINKKRKCVINEAVGIKAIPIPESVTGIVLTRIDKMTPSEQMVLKCAAILGKIFDRHVLEAILPNKNSKIFQESLNSLAEHGFIECSSLGETSLENKLQLCSSSTHSKLDECKQLKFVHAYVQETASNLWTESQCQSLHETAALYLESMAHKCLNCGGGDFVIAPGRCSRKRTLERRTTRRAFLGSIAPRQRRQRSVTTRSRSMPHHRRSTPTSRSNSTSRRTSYRCSRQTDSVTSGTLYHLSNIYLADGQGSSPFDSIYPQEDMELDFQDCHCDDVLATVYPQLVYHWKLAGNMSKTLHYLIETAIVSLATYNNMEAISLLEEAEGILTENKICERDFSKLQKAKLQNLFGQAYYQSGEINESLPYFQKALSILNCHIPTSRVGVLRSFLWQAQRQYLHVKFPRRFVGIKEGEVSECYLERSRNMAHIAHVYHLQHKNLCTFMTALYQLNMAEEAKEDVHELMEAYATVIECCQLYNYRSLGEMYYKKSLALCLSIQFEIDELPTCAHLLNVVLNMKLCQGKLDTALEIGSAVTRITSNVNHIPMKLAALPFLFYANLLKLRKEECEANIRQLAEVVQESDDLRAQAVLDCCQFDALLDIDLQTEEGTRLAASAERCCHEDIYHFDEIERFFLISCLALWHGRAGNVLANKYIDIAKTLFPAKFETYFSIRALAKFIECLLFLLSDTPSNNEKIKKKIKKVLKKFKLQLTHFPIFKSQYLQLKAHYHLKIENIQKSEHLYRKALHEGELIMSTLDCQRIQNILEKYF